MAERHAGDHATVWCRWWAVPAPDDPRVVNDISAMYGSPDEIAQGLEVLRDAGVEYVLLRGYP